MTRQTHSIIKIPFPPNEVTIKRDSTFQAYIGMIAIVILYLESY